MHGPPQGVTELPCVQGPVGDDLHKSGKPRPSVWACYRTTLDEGPHDDPPRYLNQDLLLELRPVLCTLAGRSRAP